VKSSALDGLPLRRVIGECLCVLLMEREGIANRPSCWHTKFLFHLFDSSNQNTVRERDTLSGLSRQFFATPLAPERNEIEIDRIPSRGDRLR